MCEITTEIQIILFPSEDDNYPMYFQDLALGEIMVLIASLNEIPCTNNMLRNCLALGMFTGVFVLMRFVVAQLFC